VQLLPGDTLVLFSDGVTEAMDPDEQLFGDERLCHAIAGKENISLNDLQTEILNSVHTFTRGASQNDDITVLLVRYQPESSPPS
jgi:sigma-B regulation protein RsbU (phosphoserine phosphatase)